jgi:hypothetical protein
MTFKETHVSVSPGKILEINKRTVWKRSLYILYQSKADTWDIKK